YCFFFQAEDGIRYFHVTGVQTCALPIYRKPMATGENLFSMQDARNLLRYGGLRPDRDWLQFDCALGYGLVEYLRILDMLRDHGRSEERRVGKAGRWRASARRETEKGRGE